ncbi:MAG: amino acid adenylation domain-containing protein, partial [Oscillospiraceae bacterium]|nr:amino acid adenylation domain-containing protein [Oscillospiraceae bacterium]
EKKLREIPMLTEDERKKILYSFNQTEANYPRNATLVDLFREQVMKTPDRMAVSFEEKQLTYEELDRKSDAIAAWLHTMGVGKGSLVPMYMERGIEMIVGIYGILKAGAAYVPINTVYPRDRVEYILRDCGGTVLLTGRTELPLQVNIPQLNLVTFEYDRKLTETVTLIVDPEDLAYIIYTSGTTGNPKGVMICHRNVVRLMRNSQFQFDFNEQDVWMMFHSYGFDFSVWEIYGATLFGGKLVVVGEETAKDSHALKALMLKEGVTVLNQVPSSFFNLQRACNGNENFKVRYLIFGGEALHPAKLEPWHSWYPNCKIVNMYGITETTVHVTYREIGEKEIRAGISDIGSAIPTLKVYILQGDTLCGIGVPGELCVSGEGLAHGYLNLPELTCEKFIPNPFGEGRLYRSGDLARWLPDGNLEYLGRIDEQVKIRGFRIELGEIETGIRRSQGVRDCAVVLKKDTMGEAAIYAYIVGEGEIDFGKIRNALRASMPEYMIPAYMMQIPALPTTRNGKLDRKALPDFTGKSSSEYIPARNPREQILCSLFSEILGLERIGVDQSFFELGGHSLRAVELATQIRKEFGVEFALKDVFLYPTVEQIAEYLQEAHTSEEDLPLAQERDYYPVTPAQQGVYFASCADRDGLAYNMPYLFRLPLEVDTEALRAAFVQIVSRHEIFRTRFLLVDGTPVQQILPSVDFSVESIEDLQRGEEEILSEFIKPFDLENAPLLRGKLVRRKDEYLLMLDFHHIVFDGMSSGVFFRELKALYDGSILPQPERQYKDYSSWLKEKDISKARAYWLEQFREELPVMDLTTDLPRLQERTFCGAMIATPIEKALWERLHTLAAREGLTDYTVYLAVTMILLGKYSRQEDVVLGTVSSGREHFSNQKMLGMFVNTLPLWGKPEGSKTFRGFLREIGELIRNAIANQSYSLIQLAEELQCSGDSFFRVMFAMEQGERTALRLNDLECTSVSVTQRT